MTTKLAYAIKFVDDMDAAIAFHQALGLALRFASPEWSEFDTGATTLALHKASATSRAGTCELGFEVGDVDRFYADAVARGVAPVRAPEDLHGQRIGALRDPDGAAFSVGGKPAH
ncbi:MAG TPA: VOC family protein [Casimicrobiaceae bacterium]|jgi:lactoylglutathione lyase|nr:VOC family protein [Casimicrobiaceae bacterium]